MAAIALNHPTGPYSFTQGGVAAAAQGEITGIDWVNSVVVVITGLSTETVSVTGLVSGTSVYSGKIRPIDLTTGAAAASSDLPNGSYLFKDWVLSTMKFTKSSTTDVPVISVDLKGVRN